MFSEFSAIEISLLFSSRKISSVMNVLSEYSLFSRSSVISMSSPGVQLHATSLSFVSSCTCCISKSSSSTFPSGHTSILSIFIVSSEFSWHFVSSLSFL